MPVAELPCMGTTAPMDRATFARRFRELRTAAGLSQAGAAKLLGTSQANVARWELAQMEPTIAQLPVIARVFGVTFDALLADDPPATPPRRKRPPA